MTELTRVPQIPKPPRPVTPPVPPPAPRPTRPATPVEIRMETLRRSAERFRQAERAGVFVRMEHVRASLEVAAKATLPSPQALDRAAATLNDIRYMLGYR